MSLGPYGEKINRGPVRMPGKQQFPGVPLTRFRPSVVGNQGGLHPVQDRSNLIMTHGRPRMMQSRQPNLSAAAQERPRQVMTQGRPNQSMAPRGYYQSTAPRYPQQALTQGRPNQGVAIRGRPLPTRNSSYAPHQQQNAAIDPEEYESNEDAMMVVAEPLPAQCQSQPVMGARRHEVNFEQAGYHMMADDGQEEGGGGAAAYQGQAQARDLYVSIKA